jgi:hypothetical protein
VKAVNVVESYTSHIAHPQERWMEEGETDRQTIVHASIKQISNAGNGS